MFYIYDTEGLQFSGSMEALELNRRVEKSRRLKKTGFDQYLGQYGDNPRGKAAVAAYQQSIQREDMVEPLVHIYQIMSSPVSTISPDVTLEEAWRMLDSGKIRQLVVITPGRQVQGVLSDRDVLRNLNVRRGVVEVSEDMLVRDVMGGETITTASISDIRRVARVMAFYTIDAMPVLDDSQLVGIVTRGDILRGFADNPRLNLWG